MSSLRICCVLWLCGRSGGESQWNEGIGAPCVTSSLVSSAVFSAITDDSSVNLFEVAIPSFSENVKNDQRREGRSHSLEFYAATRDRPPDASVAGG